MHGADGSNAFVKTCLLPFDCLDGLVNEAHASSAVVRGYTHGRSYNDFEHWYSCG